MVNYQPRIASIKDQIQVLYHDMFYEPTKGRHTEVTKAFVSNLEDAISEIDGALDEFRRQIETEKREIAS